MLADVLIYLKYLLNGLVVGFTASVPLGPIGVLCIQKTLNKGRASGLASGMGAATADTLYAIIAGFGLTFITNFLISQQFYLRIIGAGILFYLGARIFFTNPAIQLRRENKKSSSIWTDYVSILLLTFSNPLTVFLFGAVFAGFGLIGEKADFKSILLLILGVFLGAFLWWATLTTLVNLFRNKFRLKRLWWINKIAGVSIIVFAIVALISVFFIKV